MSFGSILKQLREDKRMSQDELGNILGVSNVAISHYERDARKPTPEMLTQLAEHFNVSTDYLLGRATNKASEFTTDKPDLKELLKTKAMSYGGTEISEHDLTLLEGVVRAILDKKGVTEYK